MKLTEVQNIPGDRAAERLKFSDSFGNTAFVYFNGLETAHAKHLSIGKVVKVFGMLCVVCG